MVIVGAGYIACEQACIFNNFGTEVHMLYMEEVALGGEQVSVIIMIIIIIIINNSNDKNNSNSIYSDSIDDNNDDNNNNFVYFAAHDRQQQPQGVQDITVTHVKFSCANRRASSTCRTLDLRPPKQHRGKEK